MDFLNSFSWVPTDIKTAHFLPAAPASWLISSWFGFVLQLARAKSRISQKCVFLHNVLHTDPVQTVEPGGFHTVSKDACFYTSFLYSTGADCACQQWCESVGRASTPFSPLCDSVCPGWCETGHSLILGQLGVAFDWTWVADSGQRLPSPAVIA